MANSALGSSRGGRAGYFLIGGEKKWGYNCPVFVEKRHRIISIYIPSCLEMGNPVSRGDDGSEEGERNRKA